MTSLLLGMVAAAFLGGWCLTVKRRARDEAYDRLVSLAEKHAASEGEQQEVSWEDSGRVVKSLSDRLGRAGFLTTKERRLARQTMFGLIGSICGLGVIIGISRGVAGVLIFGSVGLYLGVIVWLLYLRICAKKVRRETLYQLPLALEGIILLVESGLGVLPAIERLVALKEENDSSEPVTRVLRLVYELAAHGMPFGQALELIAEAVDIRALRHVLLHLDVSSSEGGELVPSLRSLSDHAHTEWRLSVETRVKRLENLVVFPVFVSVIGLMFLTAAVPIVPVLSFLDRAQPSIAAESRDITEGPDV